MRLLVVAVVVAVAGCSGPFGACGPSHGPLTWTQPGLYDALRAVPEANWSPGDGALPWTGEEPGLRLATVMLEVGQVEHRSRGIFAYSEPAVTHVSLVRDGDAQAWVDGNVSDERLVDAFLRLAANVSAAPSSELQAAAQAFAASKRFGGSTSAIPLDDEGRVFAERPHWRYVANMPGPLRFENVSVNGTPPSVDVGRVEVTDGPWLYTFTRPTWTARAMNGTFSVDSYGIAVYDPHDGPPTLDDLRRLAEADAGLLGLELALGQSTAATMVC